MVLQLVEVSHADLPKIPRMVFVKICTVMMESTCHTATTGMLAMFAYAAMAGGDVTATVAEVLPTSAICPIYSRQ